MSPVEPDPGIEHEPHRRGAGAHDPSEAKAARHLAREAGRADAEEELARHSVFNEPGAIFPPGSPAHRTGTVDRDWGCDHCGHNMRGLDPGSACPECGERSLSRPAPLEPVSYASWLRRRLDERRAGARAGLPVILVIVGGIGAVVSSAVLQVLNLANHFTGIVIMGPIMEEVMKIAVLAALVERRPYLFRSAASILVIAGLTAALFATIENALYLLVYVPSPSLPLIAWRVIVCTALHMSCTLVVGNALARVWTRSTTELREPAMEPFTRALIAAIVIHGGYNAAALSLAVAGYTF